MRAVMTAEEVKSSHRQLQVNPLYRQLYEPIACEKKKGCLTTSFTHSLAIDFPLPFSSEAIRQNFLPLGI